MAGGRPRTASLPPKEMIELGKEMVAWVKKNNPMHIKQFYSIHKKILFKDWDAMTQLPEFLPYYEQAMAQISLQYIDKTSSIRDSIAHRFLRLYFREVRNQEDEDARFEVMLKSENAEQVPESVVNSLECMLSLMRERQSARKNEAKNINNDA